MGLFTKKVALVTGGSSGIGRATAVAFAREGAKVLVASRREPEGQETLALIRQAGSDGIFVKTDVSDESQVKAMVEQAILDYGHLDYAFNNAGIEEPVLAPLAEQTVESYQKLFDINVKGVFLSMKYQIPQILKTGRGAIVNNSSVAGLVGFPNAALYAATKHAVMGLTRSTALEYAKQGLRINAVCPGGIQTDMVNRFAGEGPSEMRSLLESLHPMGRLGTPAEIAEAVIWLCSDKASFMTGQALTVDGGWTAQ
jgi:NAD(P)-dependent dehydrogenase (short-subunit alcohol dehydrogenase family)